MKKLAKFYCYDIRYTTDEIKKWNSIYLHQWSVPFCLLIHCPLAVSDSLILLFCN